MENSLFTYKLESVSNVLLKSGAIITFDKWIYPNGCIDYHISVTHHGIYHDDDYHYKNLRSANRKYEKIILEEGGRIPCKPIPNGQPFKTYFF